MLHEQTYQLNNFFSFVKETPDNIEKASFPYFLEFFLISEMVLSIALSQEIGSKPFSFYSLQWI